MEGDLLHILDKDILGDPCSQGANGYLFKVDPTPPIRVAEAEGKDPVRLTLDEAA